MAQPPAMRIHSQHCLTPQSKRKNCDLAFKYIYPTFLTEPKKSVIGTRLGCLLQEKESKIGEETGEKYFSPEQISPGAHS